MINQQKSGFSVQGGDFGVQSLCFGALGFAC